jgi:hypothetical protein
MINGYTVKESNKKYYNRYIKTQKTGMHRPVATL